MENDWYQITLNERGVPANHDVGATFVREVERIYQKEGTPNDFCVFQENNDSHDLVFYFNPAAGDWCKQHGLFDPNEGQSCGKPVRQLRTDLPGKPEGPITCVVGPNYICQALLE